MNFLTHNTINIERARKTRERHEQERARSATRASPNRSHDSAPRDATRSAGGVQHSDRDEAANLSPWQGVGSPSSSSASDFEPVALADSDVEIAFDRNKVPVQQSIHRASSLELDRSSQRRGRDRSISVEEEQELGRGVEGDDEDSSAFESAGEDGRGRGRTRERRRDPELKRSMLEDALRSSLSTILSLAPAHTGMSQTPQMSYVSLANLLSSPRASLNIAPPSLSSRQMIGARRPSPFAASLESRVEEDEEDDFDDVQRAESPHNAHDVLTASSSEEDEGYDDYERYGIDRAAASTGSRAIPIPRTQSRPTPHSLSTRDDAFFSPLQPSRPLGASAYQASDSPSAYSRRRGARRGRGAARGRASGGTSGGGSSASPQPGPASLEERRRARMAAAQSGWTLGERGGTTDVDDENVQPDEAFAELLSAARFFSDLSPRAQHSRSLPSSFGSTRTARPIPTFHSIPTPTLQDHEPDYQDDEDDPAMASESVPTLGGLSSSGAEGSRSPSSHEAVTRRKPQPDPRDKNLEKAVKGEQDRSRSKKGWFGWWGIGKTVELKVWHLVGICGILVGVGWGASSYVLPNVVPLTRTTTVASRFDFAPLTLEYPTKMSSLFL
ncbi:uncharacterized protein JCM15063_005971 [Sporobolomyces koalae]|uniref:uncharacterized protein n=1 Tax=Sporobolomyces koalae TaxID=500713 RepID=UPI00316FDBCE